MTERLKDIYNQEFLKGFGERIHTVYSSFPVQKFIADVMDETWESLELKARMRKISKSMGDFLPEDYEAALKILYLISEECMGFPYMVLPDFVEVFGQAEEHWELSMEALEHFTKQSSSEFAIRPFLLQDPVRGMKQMEIWSKHENEHVRRLSSEGCRPRLPWGVSLPVFKADPAPVLGVLMHLMEDTSLYVRKSVANNINDITKDNKTLVLDLAERLKGVNPLTDWILRQGLRTLIRKAEPRALELFGYADNIRENIKEAILEVKPSKLRIGETCEITYAITLIEAEPVHIRIEYGIDFIKANGKPSRKLFLLSDKTVKGGTKLSGVKLHSFAELTTRRHYPGNHRILLLINGQEMAAAEVTLNP
jgi:3-methyladenine DNA glycosylase AlkC